MQPITLPVTPYAVTYDGSQLTMDLFSTRLPPRWQRVLDAVIGVVCLATFAFMAWQALTVVRTLTRNDQLSCAIRISATWTDVQPQCTLPADSFGGRHE